jgi:pimeloyl-ACP methyl ester carboxylesterase
MKFSLPRLPRPPRLVRLLIRFSVCLLLLGGSLLAYVSHQGVQALLYPQRRGLDDYHRKVLAQPRDFGVELTAFTVERPDGVTIAAHYLTPRAELLPQIQSDYQRQLTAAGMGGLLKWDRPRGTLVLLHGRNSCKEHWFPAAERFARIGFNTILLDNRGHGQTQGGCCTFGTAEAADVSAVLDTVSARWGLPAAVGVMGYSLGGATAVSLVPQEPRVKCAVLVSVFANLEEIIEGPARARFGKWAGLAMPFVRLETRCRAGFHLDEICPCQTAPQVTVPCLLFHGAQDQFVKPEHSQRILAALGSERKQLTEITEAAHADVFIKGGNKLYVEITAFLQETLLAQ